VDALRLRDLSPADLADAAADNLVTHAGWVQRRLPGMQCLDRPDLVVIDSGVPCDTFNLVCRARLTGADATARVGEVIDLFRRAGRPFSWWVGPGDSPADLGAVLTAAGLERAETERAMAADLGELRPGEPAPDGLRLARVGSQTELHVYAELNAANWTPPDPYVVRFYDLASTVLLDGDCPLWLYLGYLAEEPVATAELTVGGGVVGLYNISTLPAYRRRGIGTALTRRPLLDARERGYHTAILQAAPAGVGVYERVGFHAFGDITEYKPPS
jgi:ribosomal protein S18 acetylase RimI-like enzyme